MQSPEALISQPELRRLFSGVSDMTVWRWRKNGILPEPIVINRRNFYRETDIAEMQQRFAHRPERKAA